MYTFRFKTFSRDKFVASAPRPLALTLTFLLCSTPALPQQKIVFDSLPQLLERAAAAFQVGDYPTASETFIHIQKNYSSEPDWTSGQLPRKILPLSGFASFRAQKFEDSLLAFDLFLDQYAEDPDQTSLALYLKAQALDKSGQAAKALATYQEFSDNAASDSLKGIAALKISRIQYDAGSSPKAIATLQNILHAKLAPRIATQARLRAIRFAMKSGDTQTAADLLLSQNWKVDTMPELAMLNFSAIELADQRLAAGDHQSALSCLQLTLPYPRLLSEQKSKITQLKVRYHQRRSSLTLQQSLWDDFYKQIITNLDAQLKALEDSEDYTETLRLRRALCYLQLDRPIEASLLSQQLVKSDVHSASAYKLWIRSTRHLGQEPQAIAIAKSYIAKFPESEDIYEMLFEIAVSQFNLERYATAIDSFRLLANSAHTPTLRNAALFQIGLAQAALENYAPALSTFSKLAAQTDLDPQLLGQAKLWEGLCLFYQRKFPEALTAFEGVSQSKFPLPIIIEAQFRRITCLYPLQKYESAIVDASDFLQRYPRHARIPETQVLLGDLYSAQNQLPKAIAIYQQVSPDFPELFSQATIGLSSSLVALGKVEEAKNALDQAIAQLSEPSFVGELFIERLALANEDAERNTIIEHWIHDFGNDKESAGAIEILHAQREIRNEPDPRTREYENALDAKKFTYAARLLLSKALNLQSNHRPHQAEVAILQIQEDIPADHLPPECIAYLGLTLAKIDSAQGKNLLEKFVTENPHSPFSPVAYFGLGYAAFEQNSPSEALPWLRLATQSYFEFPQAIEAKILLSKTLRQKNEYTESDQLLSELLRDRSVPAKIKAESLNLLAKNQQSAGTPEKAIAYLQRSYALYPAFQDTAIEAYLLSARLFQIIGDDPAARRTCQELLDRYPALDETSREEAIQILDATATSPAVANIET